jgi:hypothetical protein
VVLLAIAVIALAVGLSPDTSHPGTGVYNGLVKGVPLQSAQCAHWNAATDAERNQVSAALAHSVGGATPYGAGTTLSTAETASLFDRACASSIAQHWLLYELYIRAAGLRSYAPR